MRKQTNLKLEIYESLWVNYETVQMMKPCWSLVVSSQIPSYNQLLLEWTDQEWHFKCISHGTNRNLVWKWLDELFKFVLPLLFVLLSYNSCTLITSLFPLWMVAARRRPSMSDPTTRVQVSVSNLCLQLYRRVWLSVFHSTTIIVISISSCIYLPQLHINTPLDVG